MANAPSTGKKPTSQRLHSFFRHPCEKASPITSGKNSQAWYLLAIAIPYKAPAKAGFQSPVELPSNPNSSEVATLNRETVASEKTSRQVINGSMKLEELNWIAIGDKVMNAATKTIVNSLRKRRQANTALSGMSKSDATKLGIRAAHMTGPMKGKNRACR